MEYYSTIKRFVTYDNMDGPGGHYTNGNKPVTGHMCVVLKLVNIRPEVYHLSNLGHTLFLVTAASDPNWI